MAGSAIDFVSSRPQRVRRLAVPTDGNEAIAPVGANGVINDLVRHWIGVAALTLFGIAVPGIALLATEPTYQADVSFYVGGTSVVPGALMQSGQYAQSRIPTDLALAGSATLAGRVQKQLGGSASAEEVRKSIHASSASDSVIIRIVVHNHDPSVAQQIAASVAQQFPILLSDLDGSRASAAKLTVLSPAQLNPVPVGPHRLRWLLIGAGAGVLLGLLYARFVGHTLRKINDLPALAELSGLPVLGQISSRADLAEAHGQLEVVKLALSSDRWNRIRSVALLMTGRGDVPEAVRDLLAKAGTSARPVRQITLEADSGRTAESLGLLATQRSYPAAGLVIFDIQGASTGLQTILAKACDGVLLVATAGVSREADVVRTRDDLVAAGVDVVGALLYRVTS